MTIYHIAAYTGIAAIIWTILTYFIKKPNPVLLSLVKNWVGTFFVFSAVIKLVDPVGFSTKLSEYFHVFKMAFLDAGALPISIALLVLEAVIGFALLFNARMGLISKLLLGLIAFFTLLTGVSAIFDVVKDCGCFGDFLKISPWTSFIKDVVLLGMAAVIFANRKKFEPLLGKKSSKFVLGFSVLAAMAFTLHNLYNLPIWDFRPFKPGSNVVELREPIEPPVFRNILTYKNAKTGETKEFVGEFPEGDEWEWQSTDTKELSPGIPAPIKDFIINDENQNDISEAILNFDKPILLFVVTYADKAGDKGKKKIAELIEASNKDNAFNYAFISSTTQVKFDKYMEDNGFEGSQLSADATLLKTMVRSNPGVLLLKNGVVKGKWHYRNIPSATTIENLSRD